MSSLFTQIDKLESQVKALQVLHEKDRSKLELLEKHNLRTKEDIINHMAIYKRYKTRSSKYDEGKKKIELVIQYLGAKKYKEIIGNWKQELMKDRMI